MVWSLALTRLLLNLFCVHFFVYLTALCQIH